MLPQQLGLEHYLSLESLNGKAFIVGYQYLLDISFTWSSRPVIILGDAESRVQISWGMIWQVET